MLTLNFDTFATWLIAQEVQSAAEHPNIFQNSIDQWEDSEPWSREDDDFWEEMAAILLNDMRDDLVINFESLIMLTDRADELKEEGTWDEDGMYTLSPLERDISSWLDDERLESMLAKAYKAQWEFQVAIMKLVEEKQRSQQE